MRKRSEQEKEVMGLAEPIFRVLPIKRSEQEKKAMGLVDPIFRYLSIKRATRGYMPLMDIIIYAYANEEKTFKEIMQYLSEVKFYIGVSEEPDEETVETRRKSVYRINPSMVRTIETALENSSDQQLREFGLEKLKILLDEDIAYDHEVMEVRLLEEIGEKYAKSYETHEERVIVFFAKKILKYIGNK